MSGFFTDISSDSYDSTKRLIYYARVLEVSTDGNLKVKAIIDKLDRPDLDGSNDSIPWAEPFLPRMFNVEPKVGETVKIILMNPSNTEIQREWIGPIISQPEKINNDPHYYSSLNGKVGGYGKLGREISTYPNADGVYPKKDDVSFLGRDNTDIILRPSEVLIRSGKHNIGEPFKLNITNPNYIKLITLSPEDLGEGSNSFGRSDSLILSNKVFIVGRDNNSKVIKPIIEKGDHADLESKLHPVVYGDVLLEFMQILRSWIKTHIHQYGNKEIDPSGDSIRIEKWFSENLDKRLLSRNIFVGGDVPTKNT